MKRKGVVSLLVLAVVLIGVIIASANQSKLPEPSIEEIYISQGDTLWELAEKYCPDSMDCREWIYNVEKLNGIDANIKAGDCIKIYVYEKEN